MDIRPDVAFAVSNDARFCSSSTKQHWTAAKCILRYLKGTPNYGLVYLKNENDERMLIGYSNATWGRRCKQPKIHLWLSLMMSGAATSWKSRKQTCVTLYTVEAKYVVLVHATQEATWMA